VAGGDTATLTAEMRRKSAERVHQRGDQKRTYTKRGAPHSSSDTSSTSALRDHLPQVHYIPAPELPQEVATKTFPLDTMAVEYDTGPIQAAINVLHEL
jgi:hypothetical protein